MTKQLLIDAYLDFDLTKLKAALIENPNLVNRQDKDGNTLLHHLTWLIGHLGCTELTREAMSLILQNNQIDFSIKNNNDVTPLLMALNDNKNPSVDDILLPELMKRAAELNYFLTVQEENVLRNTPTRHSQYLYNVTGATKDTYFHQSLLNRHGRFFARQLTTDDGLIGLKTKEKETFDAETKLELNRQRR